MSEDDCAYCGHSRSEHTAPSRYVAKEAWNYNTGCTSHGVYTVLGGWERCRCVGFGVDEEETKKIMKKEKVKGEDVR